MQPGATNQPTNPTPEYPGQPAPYVEQPPVQAPERMADGYGYDQSDYEEAVEAPEHEIEMTWTASEFINREKTPLWFGALAGIGIALAIISQLLFKDYFTSAMIVVITLAFGVLAARRPRVQEYKVLSDGIAVNNQFHPFAEYRGFSVVDEGAVRSIILLPLKRFGFALTLYVPPSVEDQVYEHMGDHLPFLENYNDPLESILRKLHF